MSKAQKGNILIFLILAFGITWIVGIPLAIKNQPGSEPNPFEISQIGALGPAIAALILIYRENGTHGLKEFWRKITNWRFSLSWYLGIILIPLIMSGVLPTIILFFIRYGSPPPFLGPLHGAPTWKNAWWFFLFIVVIGGGQEELGWRGYLLPKLQIQSNALVSSLIIGVIWTLWHVPFLFIPGSALYGAPLIGYLIQLTLLSLILTWIYNNTDSILACILYHAWTNFTGAYLMVDVTDTIYGLLTLGTQVLVILLIILIYKPKRLSKRPVRVDNL
jgi:membrane protease YdiL (CAAX protease family)